MTIFDVFEGTKWLASFREESDAKKFVQHHPTPGKLTIKQSPVRYIQVGDKVYDFPPEELADK